MCDSPEGNKDVALGHRQSRLSFAVSPKPVSMTCVQGDQTELLTQQSCPGFNPDLRAGAWGGGGLYVLASGWGCREV